MANIPEGVRQPPELTQRSHADAAHGNNPLQLYVGTLLHSRTVQQSSTACPPTQTSLSTLLLVAPRVCTPRPPIFSAPHSNASSSASNSYIDGPERERQRERERERRETLAPIQAAASFTCASTGVAASLLRHASAPHPPPPLLSTRVVQGSSVVSRASGRARIRPERERQREKREIEREGEREREGEKVRTNPLRGVLRLRAHIRRRGCHHRRRRRLHHG